MSISRKFLASVACAGLLLAQPAAAATRSVDSLPAAGLALAHSARVGSVKGPAEEVAGVPVFGLVIFLTTVGVLTYLISTDAKPTSTG